MLVVVGVLPCLSVASLYAQGADEHAQMDQPPAELIIRTFGAVEWDASDRPETPNSFTIGQLSLFVNAPVSDRINVLAELVMEGSTNTRVVTDVERLLLTFRLDDHLQLSAGRYHTGIGFYNAAFHHGAYFDTVIGRPRVYAFEDEGGVLPVHDVGLTARGAVAGTRSALHYVAEVGNGRSWTESGSHEIGGRDENGAKATNIGVALHPPRWTGLEIGGSWYRDRVPRPDTEPCTQRIGTVYFVYRNASNEILAEWLRITHKTHDGLSYNNPAGYVQISKAWGMFRPYYRYDRLSINRDTPLIGEAGSYTDHIVGLRLDPVEKLGLKVQYERVSQREQRGIDGIRTQLVFYF